MHVETQIKALSVTDEVRRIALWVLNLLKIRRLFDDDQNYSGEECAIFASSMCLWFYGGPLNPLSDRSFIELRLNKSEVEIAFYEERRIFLVCFKYSAEGGWIAYSTESDASKRFVLQIKHWHLESRDQDSDPLMLVCQQDDAMSPAALGVIQAIIENAR